MSHYENAPAAKMLATHCAVCARPLLDAVSVETGIGPDCRKKFGYNDDTVTAENRKAANHIVNVIAKLQTGESAALGAAALEALGFKRLGQRILKRLVKVTIEVTGTTYHVTAPYTEESVALFRCIPGRVWKDKQNHVPVAQRQALIAALNRSFPGAIAMGPKGLFIIGAKEVIKAIPPAPAVPKQTAMVVPAEVRIELAEIDAVQKLEAAEQKRTDAHSLFEQEKSKKKLNPLERLRAKFSNQKAMEIAFHHGKVRA